jgi:hypothetical protein
MTHQSIELGPVLASDFDHVLEAAVGHKDDTGTFTLQEAVGGHGGAMKEAVGQPPGQKAAGPCQHGFRRISRRGRNLEGGEGPVRQEKEIGEGTSGVYRQDGG